MVISYGRQMGNEDTRIEGTKRAECLMRQIAVVSFLSMLSGCHLSASLIEHPYDGWRRAPFDEEAYNSRQKLLFLQDELYLERIDRVADLFHSATNLPRLRFLVGSTYEMPTVVQSNERIYYPEDALHAGGEVEVVMLIDERGNVADRKLLKSTNEKLNSSALDYVEGWHFTPAKLDGKQVKSVLIIPLRFRPVTE